MTCLLAVAMLAGCQEPAPPPPVVSQIPAGVKVPLTLMVTLTSGGAQEGESVPLMVREDVKDAEGRVLIRAGTLALGKVKWSRGESALSGLVNEPARLAITIEQTKTVDGTQVALTADEEGKPGEAFHLTRANTGRPEPSERIDQAIKREEAQNMLNALQEAFESGGDIRLDSESSRAVLQKLCEDAGLPNMDSVLKQGKVGELNRVLNDIRRGQAGIAAVSGGSGAAIVGACLELVGVVGDVGSRLGRMLKGRTIKAYVGTPLEATVVEPVKVTIPVTPSAGR